MAAESPDVGDTNASPGSTQDGLSDSIKSLIEVHMPPTTDGDIHVFRRAFRELADTSALGRQLQFSTDQVQALFVLVAEYGGALILRRDLCTAESTGSSPAEAKKAASDDDLHSVLMVQHFNDCPGPAADSFNKPPPLACLRQCERTLIVLRKESDAAIITGSTCGFCLESFAHDATEWAQCLKCSVVTCVACYSSWLRTCIREGEVGPNLTCGHCKEPVPADDVLKYCGEPTARRYTYFMLREEHRDNPHAFFCANDDCRKLLYAGTERLVAEKTRECADCGTRTCANCYQKEHAGDCTMPAQGFSQFRNNVWEQLHAKRCPGCDVWIQRDGGCSNMRCTHCGVTFCYRCRRPFVDVAGRGPRGDCVCSKVNEAGMWLAVIGCAVIVIPVGLAAAVVLGPPTAAVVAVLPKRKKQKLKSKWKNFWDSLKEEDY